MYINNLEAENQTKAVRRTPSLSNLVSSDLPPNVHPMCSASGSPKRKQSLCEEIGVTPCSANVSKKMCTELNIKYLTWIHLKVYKRV